MKKKKSQKASGAKRGRGAAKAKVSDLKPRSNIRGGFQKTNKDKIEPY